ncbi:hypothetical protein J6590_106749 [Homalodisca vitripennis]|nr:hypothetical protein J6590_106749 [Homalodisca vitripennis]
MTVVVNDESKHSTFLRINIVICFIPCGGPTVICFIPCGSRAADPLDGHRNLQPCSRRIEAQTVQLEDVTVALAGRGHSMFVYQCCYHWADSPHQSVDGTHGDPIECLPKVGELASHGHQDEQSTARESRRLCRTCPTAPISSRCR